MILSKIREILNIYKRIWNSSVRIKPLLPAGIYTVELASFSKKKPLLFFPFCLIKTIKPGKETVKMDTKVKRRISLYFGNKTVAFIGNKVISLYDMEGISANIKKYINYIQYPKSEFCDVSLSGNYCITHYIAGERHFDKAHVLQLAHDILKAAVSAEDVEKPERYHVLDEDNFKNIRYSVQHGDFSPTNILWVNDDDYSVIDFDTIEIYPTFYDFIFLISRGQTGLFEEFIHGLFDDEIRNYMFRHGIEQSIENFKDECIAAFVMGHHGAAIEIRCKMIRKYIPGTYIKTREALAVAEIRRQS